MGLIDGFFTAGSDADFSFVANAAPALINMISAIIIIPDLFMEKHSFVRIDTGLFPVRIFRSLYPFSPE